MNWWGRVEPETVVYGLLACRLQFTDESRKELTQVWDLFFYNSAKGRSLGALRQKREYNPQDIVTFELRVKDLFAKGALLTVIPKTLRPKDPEEELKFMQVAVRPQPKEEK